MVTGRKAKGNIRLVSFRRPDAGPEFLVTSVFPDSSEFHGLQTSGEPGWQSNGGSHRGHPARSLPHSLEMQIEHGGGELTRVHIIGVFAAFSDRQTESPGTLGAGIHIQGERDVAFRLELVNGIHYSDARNLSPIDRSMGDGSTIRTLGQTDVMGLTLRVDLLSVDIPSIAGAKSIIFRDLGSPASFVIFDAFIETQEDAQCPFHTRGGGVGLEEIPAIIRMGDRARYMRAVGQLSASMQVAQDLDEARGEALMFLAVVTAATLEMGAGRQMHRVQLEAARQMDQIFTTQEILETTHLFLERVTEGQFKEVDGPSTHLIERGMVFMERHFAKQLTDGAVAAQLGLSTSHFRHLFKEITGQPFHKYLMALRLEKARKMLLEDNLAVSSVASAVGFAGLPHFSRAFVQRFSVTPTALRRSAETS